ncbi:MAG TPA: hypothetical protein VH021_11610 [Trebonia sp.]|jgi:hypothetical protein|nr:hypothetical protein [Trebonia sp.]
MSALLGIRTPAASPAGGSAGPAAAASGSGLVITTKSGSAGAFLTDGSGRAVYLSPGATPPALAPSTSVPVGY